MTYFMVNHTKTTASFVSTSPRSICVKLVAKKAMISHQNRVFFASKQPGANTKIRLLATHILLRDTDNVKNCRHFKN